MKEALKGAVGLLGGDSAINSALGAASKIYSVQAPESASRPYILISLASGQSTNITPRDEVDIILTIKCVADTALKAADVADLVRARLHNNTASFSMDNGWNAWRINEQSRFLYAENVDKKQLFHGGANYRITAAK